MKKFDIFEVNLNPPKGHTQAGVRPGVIIQSNAFNPYSSTVILVPLTRVSKKVFPGEFWIDSSEENGLKKASRFLGHQIITLDKKFIGKKIGTLDTNLQTLATEALNIVLDSGNQF